MNYNPMISKGKIMKLVIAEKPSLGRAIADALGGGRSKDGYIETNEYTVTWCVGHLLQQKMPEQYNEEYKDWSKRPSPFIPEKFELVPGQKTLKQFKIVKGLMNKADVIVHAGDPDRAGAAIVDNLLKYCGHWNKETWRLLVADMNKSAIQKAIKKMAKSNTTVDQGKAESARAWADYLFGLNLTTAFTLAAKKENPKIKVLSIGRVQTPVLGLLVKRRHEIDNFQSHPFFEIVGIFQANDGEMKAKMKIECAESYLDEKSRLINKEFAQSLLDSVKAGKAHVESVEKEKKESKAPRLFSLSGLQKAASEQLGMNVSKTTEVLQELYESKHVSYPRSDCEYISSELWDEGKNVIQGLKDYKALSELAEKANPEIKHSCVNDSKISAHTAIIPTMNIPQLLAGDKQKLYELIVKRYLAIFMPAAIDQKTKIIIDVNGKKFRVAGTIEEDPGYRIAWPIKRNDKLLPKVLQGQDLEINSMELVTSKTTPPEEYTEASLLGAMTGISKFVSEDLKQHLKDTDGLGTEATRAKILESLIDKSFVQRQKSKMLATERGIEFIGQLPKEIISPDMTAQWEKAMTEISEGSGDPKAFLNTILSTVTRLVQNPQIKITSTNQGEEQKICECPKCSGELRRINKRDNGAFWKCQSETCKFSTDDYRGAPFQKIVPLCPECERDLKRIKGNNGIFWGCTGFKDGCKYNVPDNKGKPGKKEAKKPLEKSNQECPSCKSDMFKRKGKYGDFLGCSKFPECKETIKL